MSLHPEAKRVLDFWFGTDPNEPKKNSHLWYKKDPAFDAEIREKFLDLVQLAKQKELAAWHSHPLGWVANVILLDQFTRNIYRDQAEAFACDEIARDLVRQGLAKQIDTEIPPVHAWFFLMPLMHSEALKDQDDGIQLFQKLHDSAPEDLQEGFKNVIKYAHLHRDIVARFGRFPHRNKILGRETTPEEDEFLTQPNSSF